MSIIAGTVTLLGVVSVALLVTCIVLWRRMRRLRREAATVHSKTTLAEIGSDNMLIANGVSASAQSWSRADAVCLDGNAVHQASMDTEIVEAGDHSRIEAKA